MVIMGNVHGQVVEIILDALNVVNVLLLERSRMEHTNSDLISREALIKELNELKRYVHVPSYKDVFDILMKSKAIEQGEPVTPDFFQLDNGSDYWYECPDDAGIIGDLHDVEVGTKYDVFASHTYRQTYKVVKMPDDKDDDTLVELVSSQRQYYTTPQQPQSVADALEDAAKIAEEICFGRQTSDDAGSNRWLEAGKCGRQTAEAIRALIKRNAEEG